MSKNLYFEFLCNIVGRQNTYGHLLDILHRMEFYSLVPNDDNRGADGEQLRTIFLDEVELDLGRTSPLSLSNLKDKTDAVNEINALGRCTLLEMLIGLAHRLEFELLGGKFEKSADYWFWILIDNLGLLWCVDVKMHHMDTIFEVEKVLENLLDRKYGTDGEGGLFPLKNPEKDQRRVEIWYQMSAWVIENYPI